MTGPAVGPDRPLDGIGSVKLKFGILVGLSIVAAVLVSEIGNRAGVPWWLTVPVTVAAALGVTQWLARGMTSPLREMTRAAARMATGDYSERVTATSADEVGRLARAFNTMAADLAAADRQRRQLLATVSHELRTPLAAQRALLENLVDGVVTPDDATLQSALAQSERLSDLVGDLLDLSRVDGGAASLQLGPVRVADLVQQAVAEAGVGGRDVRYASRVSPPDLEVEGDAARLSQVVANLLDNATRHSPTGGEVVVRAAADGPDRWLLEVTDEGPGIPADRAESVFTSYWSDSDGGGGGTGLGLAIASWVCELHGGSIASLPPAPGASGARIRAVLPRRPAPPSGSGAEPAPSPVHVAPAAPSPTPGPAAAAPATVAESATQRPAPSHRPPGSVHRPEEHAMSTTTSVPPSVPSGGSAALSVQRPSFAEAVFGGLWPERGPRTAPVALLASLAVGAVAALVLPERQWGVGTLLVLLLAGGVVLATSVRRSGPWTSFSVLLCLGLGSMVVLRAAEWLAVLSMLVVAVLVTTALTDARRVLPMAAGVAAWALSALRGLPLLGRTITATSGHRLLWPVLRTAAISLVALVVFGGLFASGDAVFGSWAAAVVPDLAWDSMIFRSFVLVAVGGVVLAGCYLALNPPRVEQVGLPEARPVTRRWEWLVPVGVVVAVFAGFVVAQASAMWGGHDYVRRMTGMSYADYVHQGFGQLTLATTLTLATVALTVRKASAATSRDRLVLRVVLGLLCVLTLVVVASALFRMAVYQQAFGYTVLRVLVDAFELWLGVVVVLVMVAGIRWSGAWLPRAALASGAVFLLVIGLANPEAWVAERNIERYDETGKIDTWYLATLGPDAAPTIVKGLPADLRRCALPDGPEAPPRDLLEWNLGRAEAADVTPAVVDDRTDCP
ncbi:DUF4153 domain-containing protein [Georgenia subflava]|uniref:Signal transduction histidine-protein kinase/phosphatase MprB n=1 Tax=Georgenia subflava TaxID=1622177 RepID=A0A6N7EKW3_9MICO|nr:DUF4153 domain-containing protein [Georgenia subflava]MPV37457.1 DUF4173 domain-containing protein [Georgenia subflava]